MGLEAATFIHELDPSNPIGGSDPKSQGDDHIRLTKSTLQNTLPNVEGAVTASHTELNILDGATLTTAELNFVDGVTSAIQTQLDAKANANVLTSGRIVAAATAVSNCTIGSAGSSLWQRQGNIVTVHGFTDLATVTSGGAALTQFSVQVPIEGMAGQVAGVGSVNVTGGPVAYVEKTAGQERVTVKFFSSTTGAQRVYYTYSYELT